MNIGHYNQVKLDISNLSLERLLEETIEHRTYQFLSKLRDQLSLVPEVEVRLDRYK